MWFKKKKEASLPQAPVFSGSPAPQQVVQEPPQEQHEKQPPVIEAPPVIHHDASQLEKPAKPLQVQQQVVQEKPLPRIEMPEVQEPVQEFPQRQPAFLQKKHYPQREAMNPEPVLQQQEPVIAHDEPPQTQGMEHHELQTTPPANAEVIEPHPIEQPQDKPVFVKLEQYKDAVATIDLLKEKIKDTEQVIDNMEELRSKEQIELDECRKNLQMLKEKLLHVDKKLFEA